jgi:YD repeat-containing protein
LPSTVAATPDIDYTYNYNLSSKGTLSAITVGDYQETFNYDGFERVSSRNWTRDSKSYTISYQYNAASQRKQITYPSNRKINVSYNNQGKMLSLVDNDLSASYLTSVSYNHAGQLTGMTQGSGTAEACIYLWQQPNAVDPTDGDEKR